MMLSAGDAASQQNVRAGVANGRLSVEVDDEVNALDHAIAALIRVCKCAISYEEPEWSYSGDLGEMPDSRGRAVVVAKRSSLSASISVNVPVDRQETVELLGRLLEANEQNGSSARFDIIQGRTIEVRPGRVKNAQGDEVATTLLLDTPISLQRGSEIPAVWLQRVAQALRRETGKDVMAAFQPGSPVMSQAITLEADGESARTVLDRMLGAMPRQGAWAVNYIPSMKRYSLVIRVPVVPSVPER
ncbi:MAG TPA: hypothetical protein PLH72_04845 [Vicinamibacterales bacterium]|nr:hypothetical protein [Vicinamibacterales bacterium]HQZ38346.1 hypothetical protein [Vicinamibacterales bacterium]